MEKIAVFFIVLLALFVLYLIAPTLMTDYETSPHSGATPDCPVWEEPENTLPPTYNL